MTKLLIEMTVQGSYLTWGWPRVAVRYDTFAPVIFAGAGLSGQRIDRSVTPYDIAPTLAARLHVKPPSGAVGTTLIEVLGQEVKAGE